MPIQPSDQVFDKLSNSFGKYAIEALVNSKDERNTNVAFLLALAVLAYAGVETTNLLFRRNFGKKGVHVLRLILSVASFIIIALVAFDAAGEPTNSIGSPLSCYVTSVIYTILAVKILIKGFGARLGKGNVPDIHYRGDSYTLRFLINEGKSQANIQNFAEPLLLLSIGVFLAPINLLLGIPLIFCAISSWLHLALETFLDVYEARNILANDGANFQRNRQYSPALKN